MKIGGAIVNGLALTLFLVPARAEEISVKVLQSLSTPAEVKTRIGNLTFKDGAPSDATLDKVYDNLDFTHAFEAFLNTMEGVNVEAARKALPEHRGQGQRGPGLLRADGRQVAVPDGECRHRLFRRRSGPHERADGARNAAAASLGTIDDIWFRWVIDFGLPGPDRGEGGKYLIVPPGYDGPLPEGGFFVACARTNRVLVARPRVHGQETIRSRPSDVIKASSPKSIPMSRVARHQHRRVPRPEGQARQDHRRRRRPFHEGSGKVVNTVPPNDSSLLRDA